MSHTISLDDLDLKFEIQNADNDDEWFEALKDHCDDFASDHYCLRYEPGSYVDLCEKSLKQLAEASGLAIKAFREFSNEEIGDNWNQKWSETLQAYLADVIDEWLDGSEDFSALYSHDFERIYEALDEAMTDIEGPVVDLDSLFERLRAYTEEKMVELDTSTPMDYIRGHSIPMIFTPGADLTESGRDDLMFYKEKSNDPNLVSLLKLLRIPGEAFIEGKEIDYTSREEMRDWDKLLEQCSDFEHVPVCGVDMLDTIIDNSSTYNLPAWIGSINLSNLSSTNFREPVAIKGGVVGAIDYINGAGYVDTFDGHVILYPTDTPSAECGYSCKSIFDFTQRTMEARLLPITAVELKEAPEAIREYSSDDKLSL